MPHEPPTAVLRKRRIRPAGFTLVELTVVLVIIGALVAMSAPSYSKAVEQSRANIAAANLRAIWSAQRLYWLGYRQYATAAELQTLKLLDKDVLDSLINGTAIGGFTYSLNRAADGSTFTASATHDRSSSSMSIDQDGTLTASGWVTPGFQ